MTNRLLDESGNVLLDESGNILGNESYDTFTGSGAATLPAVTASGSGNQGFTGSGAPVLPALASSGAGVSARSGSGAPTLPVITTAGQAALRWSGSGTPSLPAIEAWGFGRTGPGGSAAIDLPAITAAGYAGATAARWVSSATGTITIPAGRSAGEVGILIDFCTAAGGTAAQILDESGNALLDESGEALAKEGGAPPDEVVPAGWTKLDGASHIDTGDSSRIVVSARSMSAALDGTFVTGMTGGSSLMMLLILEAHTAGGVLGWTLRQADAIQSGTGAATNTTIEQSLYSSPMLGIAVKAVRATSGGLTPTLDTSPAGGFDQPVNAYLAEAYGDESMAIEANHIFTASGSASDATVATADDGDTQFFTAFLLELAFGSTGTGAPSLPEVTGAGSGGVNSVARIETCVIQQGVGVIDLVSGTVAEISGEPSAAEAGASDRVAEISDGPSTVVLADERNRIDIDAVGETEAELQES